MGEIIQTEENSLEQFTDLYTASPFLPRLTYSMNGEKITAYEFVSLKALGRSPSGHYQTSFLAVALESGIVRIYDTFLGRSLLFEFTVPTTHDAPIVQISSSTIPDDMSISVLTSNGILYVFEI